jgi:hypothetical protein
VTCFKRDGYRQFVHLLERSDSSHRAAPDVPGIVSNTLQGRLRTGETWTLDQREILTLTGLSALPGGDRLDPNAGLVLPG